MENWGVRGRWSYDIGGNVVWQGGHSADPYNTLTVDPSQVAQDQPAQATAKEVAEKLTEEGAPLYFADVKGHESIEERVKLAALSEKCRLDPFFFVEHYKTDLQYPPMYKMIAEHTKKKFPNHNSYVCVNPRCMYIRLEKIEDFEEYSVKKCRSCDEMTGYNAKLVTEHGTIPDVLIMSLATHKYSVVRDYATKMAALSRMADENEHIDFDLWDYKPALRISKNLPGLRVEGEHFIRGRVNRHVLVDENKCGLWPNEADEPEDYIDGQDEDPVYDLVLRFGAADRQTIDLLTKVVENPKVLLDPTKADRFREEYIDARWDEEFALYVSALVDKGILTVDSSGVSDTLTTLYHLAQRKAGKKTVIKKDGKIKFPTKEVLENISPDLIKRAFAATEHAAYADPQQVFRLGEVIHE